MMQRFARWLLLLVVAFDLAGAPFHPHSHDFGAGHAGTAGAAWTQAQPVLESPDPAPVGGHSMLAVRTARQFEATTAAEAAFAPAPTPPLQAAPQAPVLRLAAPAQLAPRPSPPRSWPEGRAPPYLPA